MSGFRDDDFDLYIVSTDDDQTGICKCGKVSTGVRKDGQSWYTYTNRVWHCDVCEKHIEHHGGGAGGLCWDCLGDRKHNEGKRCGAGSCSVCHPALVRYSIYDPFRDEFFNWDEGIHDWVGSGKPGSVHFRDERVSIPIRFRQRLSTDRVNDRATIDRIVDDTLREMHRSGMRW